MIWKIFLIGYNLFLLVLLIGTCLKTAQQGKRILDIEKRWADFKRRNFNYKNLVLPPDDKDDEFGIEDIEKAAAAEKAKLRNHGIIIE